MLKHEHKNGQEAGFTLLETSIAMVLLAVVGLGIASCFFFAAKNNSSAKDRDLAMAVAQQAMEQYRSASFIDASLSAGTTNNTVIRARRTYSVQTTITDGGVQNGSPTTKRIQIRVVPLSEGAVWARNVNTLFGSVTIVCQRTAQTMGPNRTF
jgi:prepilin-type N-terminal cleavage/methylation domain-containing protein